MTTRTIYMETDFCPLSKISVFAKHMNISFHWEKNVKCSGGAALWTDMLERP